MSSAVPSIEVSVVIAIRAPLTELDLAVLHLAGPDLRAGEVLEERHRAVEAGRDVPGRADDLEVLLLGAVGEVQPEDVHAGADQALELLGAARGRPDGGDDLRSAHGVPSIGRRRAGPAFLGAFPGGTETERRTRETEETDRTDRTTERTDGRNGQVPSAPVTAERLGMV